MDESNIIALKDVESTYKTKAQELLYLKSINLTVTKGEILAIIGRAGAGKSALLRCIGLVERPLTGIISIDNKNLTFMASKELCSERRHIGFITPKPNLLNSKNLSKNIALPLQIQGFGKDEIQKQVDRALTRVGLENKAHLSPASLTATQKIQADIARNLVNNPKILLCDDIFNGLDQKSTETIANILRSLQHETRVTILISTNDAELIKSLCQNVIVMQQGSIVEQCSIADLFLNPISEVAKDFVRFATKHELPNSLRRKIITQATPGHHALVRISFADCLAPEEILSNTIEAYELRMNIIQAYQEKIHEQLINIMLIEIYGENDTISQAVTFLNTNGLQSEIIGYVPDIN
jgi:D-methionine transport system ATP-binding protein